jgi:hypothetical protein
MRAGVWTLFAVLCAAPAFAQAHDPGLDRFDPYDPSDAQLLADYGGALATELPLRELRKLDIYNPTEAALRRDYGGGLPLWGLVWYPLYPPAPVVRAYRPAPVRPAMPGEARAPEPSREPSPEAAGPPAPTRMATLYGPEGNDGVWIEYDGRRWISAGKAVPFDAAAFERAGEYGGFDVYRRRDGANNLIYLPSREGLIAPYRVKE